MLYTPPKSLLPKPSNSITVTWFSPRYDTRYTPSVFFKHSMGKRLFNSFNDPLIASIIAFLVLVLAWYLCLGKDIFDAYQLWYQNGEIDYTISYPASVRIAPLFLADPEIGPAYYKDLAIGLGFALLGSIGTIITEVKSVKAKKSLLESENNSQNPESDLEEKQKMSTPLRSAQVDEKVREYIKENAFGHEIIFRKVAKSREELVIDGMVYAEHILAAKTQTPYEMHASVDNHCFEAGYGVGYGNYISVDKVVIAKRFRWW